MRGSHAEIDVHLVIRSWTAGSTIISCCSQFQIHRNVTKSSSREERMFIVRFTFRRLSSGWRHTWGIMYMD